MICFSLKIQFIRRLRLKEIHNSLGIRFEAKHFYLLFSLIFIKELYKSSFNRLLKLILNIITESIHELYRKDIQ